MTDDGWEDEPDEPETTEYRPALDVPGYLVLTDEKLKAEARRAYALNHVVNGEGSFHPQWLSVVRTIEQYLIDGTFPQMNEIKSIKGNKP
jgi:hypothetical protein